jgi:putative ABC transport system substrate-binding protein
MIRRREFITLLGGAAAWPVAARAQQAGGLRLVGVLMTPFSQTDREGEARIAAFLETFQRLGWINGRNVRIDVRWAAGDADRIKASAAEMVHSGPAVIVALGSPALSELQQLTSTIPIVFTQVSDAVGGGFVAGQARPGGNITGFQVLEPAIGGKCLGLLKEAAPNLSRAAVLFASDMAASNVAFLRAVEAVGPSLGVMVSGGLIVVTNPVTIANRDLIILLAARYGLPAIYPYRYFAAGLLSYGPDQVDEWRGAATYVDRILRGEKPGDLPVQFPTKFEMILNLKTAKALGLTIPLPLLGRADEVIE